MDIHQFNPTLSTGDAISNHVISLQTMLQAMGHQSKIFCEIPPVSAAAHTLSLDEYEVYSAPENILLLHFSLHYSDWVMDRLTRLPGKKILIFHNITPPHYFLGVNNMYFEAASRGYAQLTVLSVLTDAGWGDSDFNTRILQQHGWQKTGILPIAFDERSYAVTPAPKIKNRYASGTKVLFVGRVSPNKRFEDLLVAFHYLKKLRPDAQLLLVGSTQKMTRYVDFLQTLIDRLNLKDVHFLGHVSLAELAACYQIGDVFLNMSEHEGFGVPLLESMHYGLPVVAYKSTAVSETLGDSGILFREKDYRAIAALIDVLLSDDALRRKIIEGQRRRLKNFSVAQVQTQLRHLLADVGVN